LQALPKLHFALFFFAKKATSNVKNKVESKIVIGGNSGTCMSSEIICEITFHVLLFGAFLHCHLTHTASLSRNTILNLKIQKKGEFGGFSKCTTVRVF